MKFALPKEGNKALPTPHFPTRLQAFIFRAQEYVPYKKIAELLGTTEQNIKDACVDMGLKLHDVGDIWLKKGYITIIKQMWHILPYDQLLELVNMSEDEFGTTLREEDFLDIKLQNKPVCEHIKWQELTDEQKEQTKKIKETIETISFDGAKPFDFKYNVPEIKFSGKEYFKTRYIYGFSGLYLHAFDIDSREYCPDAQLEAYQKLGINGIWTQAVLYQLTPYPFAPELSKGYEKRLAYLNDFIARCKKYGIKVYLYLNEPRAMPLEFADKYPHLAGHRKENDVALCTSTKEVQDYLKNNIEWLCRNAEGIGGFFTITKSENHTHCYSHSTHPSNPKRPCNCIRCSKRSVGEVIGEVVSCIEEGAHRVSPDIKVIAWDWAWGESNLEIINHLPKNVTLLCKSEQDVPFEYGGVKHEIHDYSISKVGPGEHAKEEWRLAKKRGITLGAKVQMNTSWECSTVPAVPTYPNVEKLMEDLKAESVEDLMLSWTLGGYPSLVIAHAAKHFYEKCEMPEISDNEKRACKILCDALNEFPPELHLEYRGPQNGGPSNPLYLEPTGYSATMTCFAYDDLDLWSYDYPVDVYENQLIKVVDGLKKALAEVEGMEPTETIDMLRATYNTFKSSLNQTQFILARNSGDKAKMKKICESEIEIAANQLELMNKNAIFGFEAANHYYYSKGQLAEKILNCKWIIEKI